MPVPRGKVLHSDVGGAIKAYFSSTYKEWRESLAPGNSIGAVYIYVMWVHCTLAEGM